MFSFLFIVSLLAVATRGNDNVGNSAGSGSEHFSSPFIIIGSASLFCFVSSLACGYYYLGHDCKRCSSFHEEDSVRSIEFSADITLEQAFPNMKPAFKRMSSSTSDAPSTISSVSINHKDILNERNSVHFDPELPDTNPREEFNRSRQGSFPILEELMDGSMIDLSDGDEDLVWDEEGNSHKRTHSVIFDVSGELEACHNKNDYEFQDE